MIEAVDHAAYMSMAFDEAESALAANEVPVGCIIVDAVRNVVVARGANQTNRERNVYN